MKINRFYLALYYILYNVDSVEIQLAELQSHPKPL